jgi:hypothetical protein
MSHFAVAGGGTVLVVRLMNAEDVFLFIAGVLFGKSGFYSLLYYTYDLLHVYNSLLSVCFLILFLFLYWFTLTATHCFYDAAVTLLLLNITW